MSSGNLNNRKTSREMRKRSATERRQSRTTSTFRTDVSVSGFPYTVLRLKACGGYETTGKTLRGTPLLILNVLLIAEYSGGLTKAMA